MAYNVSAVQKTLNSLTDSLVSKSTKTDSGSRDEFGQALASASANNKTADREPPKTAEETNKAAAADAKETEGTQDNQEPVTDAAAAGAVIWGMAQAMIVQQPADGEVLTDASVQGITNITAEIPGEEQQLAGMAADASLEAEGGTVMGAVSQELAMQSGVQTQQGAEMNPVAEQAASAGEEVQMTQEAGVRQQTKGVLDEGKDRNVHTESGQSAHPAENVKPGQEQAGQKEASPVGQQKMQKASENVSVEKASQQGEDENRIVDIHAEALADKMNINSAAAQRPDAGQQVSSQTHITETGEMREEYADMLKDLIARQITDGKREIELQLTPRSLGTMLVKVAYEAGETNVSIICSNQKAMNAMTQKAGELGRILEESLGTKMDVVVETDQSENSQLYQDGRNGSGAQQQQERQEEAASHSRRMREQEESGADFLQQLRLGLG